jgi:hypothetical protein
MATTDNSPRPSILSYLPTTIHVVLGDGALHTAPVSFLLSLLNYNTRRVLGTRDGHEVILDRVAESAGEALHG